MGIYRDLGTINCDGSSREIPNINILIIIIKQVLLGGYTFVMFCRRSHFDQEDLQERGNDIFCKAGQ